MKKPTLRITLFIISFFTAIPLAFSQDVGATFCWQYKEIYGGQSELYNQSIVTDNLPSSTTSPKWYGMTQWWENMVEEIAYSGLDYVALLSRGYQPNYPDANGDRGNGNPVHIPKFINAMDDRGVGSAFKVAIFDDAPNSWCGSRNYNVTGNYNTSTKLSLDIDNNDTYNYIWDYNLKMAIDNIPDAKRYKINGKFVIIFWSVKDSWFTNIQGNLSKILNKLRIDIEARYGFKPYLVIDKDWLNFDSTLANAVDADGEPTVDGVHGWFSSANQISQSLYTWNGVKYGVCNPGMRGPGMEDQGPFVDPGMGTSDMGKRLKYGLDNTAASGARLTLVEGFTDANEAAALWRSRDNTFYDYPNQRINILRRYTSDPYPATLKMEAEACDQYSDTSTGNSGGKFLKSGNLDVEECSDTYIGWNVTNTQANEWMEWKELPLLASTKFKLRYKSTASASIKFSVDGTALSTISLPSTSGVWTTIDAGNYSVASNSLHTVRLTIVSGSPDINYFSRVNGTATPASNVMQNLQAEDATYSGAILASNQTGYKGSGFVDFVNDSGDYIQWTVNVPTAGTYELSFRYALPNGGRPLELKVNNTVKIASMDFPATGLWNTWLKVSTSQTLNAGNNTIRITSIGSNGGNIDMLSVSPYLDTCDALSTWDSGSANTLSYTTSNKKQGTGSLQMIGSATDEFKKVFSPAFNSGTTISNGTLSFWYFVSDVTKTGTVRVELGSGGVSDVNELSWPLTGLSNGWNQISLNFSDASQIGTPNLNALNWFRIYDTKSASITTRIDAIQVLNSATVASSQRVGKKETKVTEVIPSSEGKSVTIYPNPYKDGTLSLDILGFESSSEVQLKVTNLLGQVIHQEILTDKTHKELNLSGSLNESVYFISLEAGENKVVKKLIVK